MNKESLADHMKSKNHKKRYETVYSGFVSLTENIKIIKTVHSTNFLDWFDSFEHVHASMVICEKQRGGVELGGETPGLGI